MDEGAGDTAAAAQAELRALTLRRALRTGGGDPAPAGSDSAASVALAVFDTVASQVELDALCAAFRRAGGGGGDLATALEEGLDAAELDHVRASLDGKGLVLAAAVSEEVEEAETAAGGSLAERQAAALRRVLLGGEGDGEGDEDEAGGGLFGILRGVASQQAWDAVAAAFAASGSDAGSAAAASAGGRCLTSALTSELSRRELAECRRILGANGVVLEAAAAPAPAAAAAAATTAPTTTTTTPPAAPAANTVTFAPEAEAETERKTTVTATPPPPPPATTAPATAATTPAAAEVTGELAALQAAHAALEGRHTAQLAEIDRVFNELRASETALVSAVVRSDTAADAALSRASAAELRHARAGAEAAALEEALRTLEEEALAGEGEGRRLEAELLAGTNHLRRLERRLGDSVLVAAGSAAGGPAGGAASAAAAAAESEEAAAVPADRPVLRLVEEQTARERVLRGLDDRLLNVDELITEQAQALDHLRDVHAALADVKKVQCDTALEELAESKKVAESLARTLSKLEARRDDAGARHAGVAAEVAALEARHLALTGVRRGLEDDLAEGREADAQLERALDAYVAELIGEEGTARRLEKLEESMHLLKGVAVNVAGDYFFIGDVHAAFGADGSAGAEEGLLTALGYVRSYVVAAHGKQRHGDRWVVDSAHEPSYDEVERLLTSVKQVAVCYDMLPVPARLELGCSRELIRNTNNLVHLARVGEAKYAEMRAMQAARAEQARREREEHVRRTIAPKAPQRPSSVLLTHEKAAAAVEAGAVAAAAAAAGAGGGAGASPRRT